MAKRRRKPTRKLTDQLNVRVTNELFRRVNSVAGARGETLTKFVNDVLAERTKGSEEDVERIAARERVPKRWQ